MFFSHIRLLALCFALVPVLVLAQTTKTKVTAPVTVAPVSNAVNAPDVSNSVNYLPEVTNVMAPAVTAVAAPSVTAPVIQSSPQGGTGIASVNPTAAVSNSPNALDQRGLVTYAPAPVTVTSNTTRYSSVSQAWQMSTNFMLPAIPMDKEVACMPPGAKVRTVARVLIESGALWGVNHVPSRVVDEKGKSIPGLSTQEWGEFEKLPYKSRLIRRPGVDEPFELLLGRLWVYTQVLVASNAGGHISGSYAGGKGLSVGSGTTIGITDIVQRITYKGTDCVHNGIEYQLYMGVQPADSKNMIQQSFIAKTPTAKGVVTKKHVKHPEVKLTKNGR